MSEVVWVATIGAIAGLIAGLGGAYLTVLAQARQADRERWAHRRHEAYADVIVEASDVSRLVLEWWGEASAALGRNPKQDLPPAIESSATDGYDRASGRAELIASWRGFAVHRLLVLDFAVGTVRVATLTLDNDQAQAVVDGVLEAYNALEKAKREFAEAARVELGVDKEGVMSPWRTRWYKIRRRLSPRQRKDK